MAYRTLDPYEQKRLERREKNWEDKPRKNKKRRKSERPPEFNPRDWK